MYWNHPTSWTFTLIFCRGAGTACGQAPQYAIEALSGLYERRCGGAHRHCLPTGGGRCRSWLVFWKAPSALRLNLSHQAQLTTTNCVFGPLPSSMFQDPALLCLLYPMWSHPGVVHPWVKLKPAQRGRRLTIHLPSLAGTASMALSWHLQTSTCWMHFTFMGFLFLPIRFWMSACAFVLV